MAVSTKALIRAALIVLLGLLVVSSWFPFRPAAPAWRRSIPTTTSGVLAFDGRSVAWDQSPEWLSEAIDSGTFRLEIEARSRSSAQEGPARLFTISESVQSANFSIGQEGADLVLRLRRGESTELGTPPVVLAGLFADEAWHVIAVEAEIDRFRIDVDGQTIAAAQTPTLARWDPSHSAALGDEPAGDRGWKGELRRADVSVGEAPIDLMSQTDWREPSWVFSERVRGATRAIPTDPVLLSLARTAVWATAGALACLLSTALRRLSTMLALPAALTLGKLFADGRDPRLSDIILGSVGLTLGWAATRLAARRRFHPPESTTRRRSALRRQ